MFYIGLYSDNHKRIFLSKTICQRALIIDIKQPLVHLYQVCSNYAPLAQNGPALGVTCFTLDYIGNHIIISSSDV